VHENLKVLTPAQLVQYDRDGYLQVKGAARPATLALARNILARWVDELIDGWVAKGLLPDPLGTPEILRHGVFNARPKAPDQKWTDTPWHQDAQDHRDAAHLRVVSFWIPLQRVTELNSCLQIAPGLHVYDHAGDTEAKCGPFPDPKRKPSETSCT
jgi:hypothetical protein